jgi:PhzF family phenazine biosynthesis protein
MAKTRRFVQCDVFSSVPTKGNALAVVVDGEGLTDKQMQEFAAWTNLAETTFLLPPNDSRADYRVRIFTTTREMLFAGHPTLGSCAAWLHSGGMPREPGIVRQECGVGIVDIELGGEVPAFIAPPTKIAPLPEADKQSIIAALRLNPDSIMRTTRLDNGPVWQVFALDSAEAVLAVDSALVKWPEYKSVGLIGPHKPDHECDYEVRMLAPSSGMSEDPITGSLNSALSHWLHSTGDLNRNLVIAQGTSINRLGRVYIQPVKDKPGRVAIGGQTHILIEGSVIL